MIGALFRLLATVALAAGVIMAVLDATRSIAASAVVLTPLSDAWAGVSPSTFQAFDEMIGTNLPAFAHTIIVDGILAAPGFVVFGALALLLYSIGRPRARIDRRFAVQR